MKGVGRIAANAISLWFVATDLERSTIVEIIRQVTLPHFLHHFTTFISLLNITISRNE